MREIVIIFKFTTSQVVKMSSKMSKWNSFEHIIKSFGRRKSFKMRRKKLYLLS